MAIEENHIYYYVYCIVEFIVLSKKYLKSYEKFAYWLKRTKQEKRRMLNAQFHPRTIY